MELSVGFDFWGHPGRQPNYFIGVARIPIRSLLDPLGEAQLRPVVRMVGWSVGGRWCVERRAQPPVASPNGADCHSLLMARDDN